MVESRVCKNSYEDRTYFSDYGNVKDGAIEEVSIRLEGRMAYQRSRSAGLGGENE